MILSRAATLVSSDVGAADRSDVAVHWYWYNHRDVRRRSALASAVAMVVGWKGRSARIVGGGSQRGPTERRQQAESLAHSFSVPFACSFSPSSSVLLRFFSPFLFPQSPLC